MKSGDPAKEETDRDKFLKTNFGFLVDHIARLRGRTACSVRVFILFNISLDIISVMYQYSSKYIYYV